MITSRSYSFSASREQFDELNSLLEKAGRIKDFGAGPSMQIEVLVGSPDHKAINRFLERYNINPLTFENYQASPEELVSEPFFSDSLCRWIEDCDPSVSWPLPYSGKDACPECGKGMMELTQPIKGNWQKKKRPLYRVPPALVVGSAGLAELIRENEWTGVEICPVIERKAKHESERYFQLKITSILPPMHSSAPIHRSIIPDFCPRCRKLGYQLPYKEPCLHYSREITKAAKDWNLSSEWLAPHYVSCPRLICSRHVVHELLKLDKFLLWVPLHWCD